jgi:hypothetical protein
MSAIISFCHVILAALWSIVFSALLWCRGWLMEELVNGKRGRTMSFLM